MAIPDDPERDESLKQFLLATLPLSPKTRWLPHLPAVMTSAQGTMLTDFEAWAPARSETNTFEELGKTTLGVEAKWFLKQYFVKGEKSEPLVAALGGLPFGAAPSIRRDLHSLTSSGIVPIFIFEGLNAGRRIEPFKERNLAAQKTNKAWAVYQAGEPSPSVDAFAESGWAQPEIEYKLLQSILHEEGLEWRVAPYGAAAQIAKFYNNGQDYFDAIAGSPDLLLYDVDKIIYDIDYDEKRFSWVERRHWFHDLEVTSNDEFVDACLLSGTSLLTPLQDLRPKPPMNVQDALQMMRTNGKTGYSIAEQLVKDETRLPFYLNQFTMTRLAIKHGVVMTDEGRVGPMDAENAPNDLNEIVGQLLPEELYFYLSLGVIGPRLLNMVTSEEIYENVSIDGGESEEYRDLVQNKLMPLRQKTLLLLAQRTLNRYYENKEYIYRTWFEPDRKITFKPGDTTSSAAIGEIWKVQRKTFPDNKTALEKTKDGKPSLDFALEALKFDGFAATTILAKGPSRDKTVLEDAEDILPNVLWRFLHARDYINEKHELTDWGKVLSVILENLRDDMSSEMQEAALLATELLRYGLMNSNDMWPTYERQAQNGTATDRANCVLVSRVASLLQLRHQAYGYSGVLSRPLLGYNAMISAIQNSLRDLLEACLTSFMIKNHGKREGMEKELMEMGFRLPFLLPLNAALGVAVNNYLDQLPKIDGDFEAGKNKLMGEDISMWLPQAIDFEADLKRMWKFWEAIVQGVQTGATLGVLPKKMGEDWKSIDAWAAKRK